MIHELKIRKEFFDAVIIGKKTFEVRKDDRGFKVGERIHFTIVDERGIECEKLPKEVDEKYNNFVITYVLPGGDYGLLTGYCVLGIKQLVIFNSADEPISRVRDLISVLNFSRPDDIITINVDDQEDVWYELIDVMRGSGTSAGITTLRIESQEEEDENLEV